MPKFSNLLQPLQAAFRSGLRAISSPAEDPREHYADGFQRQSTLLAEVQAALEDLSATKQYLAEKTAELQVQLPELEAQAVAALDKGHEEAAWEALERKVIVRLELDELEDETSTIEGEQRRLTVLEDWLLARIEAFVAEQDVLLARYSAAEARLKINDSMQEASRELTRMSDDLAQVASHTRQMQARVADIDQMVGGEPFDAVSLSRSAAQRKTDPQTIRQRAQEQMDILKKNLK